MNRQSTLAHEALAHAGFAPYSAAGVYAKGKARIQVLPEDEEGTETFSVVALLPDEDGGKLLQYLVAQNRRWLLSTGNGTIRLVAPHLVAGELLGACEEVAALSVLAVDRPLTEEIIAQFVPLPDIAALPDQALDEESLDVLRRIIVCSPVLAVNVATLDMASYLGQLGQSVHTFRDDAFISSPVASWKLLHESFCRMGLVVLLDCALFAKSVEGWRVPFLNLAERLARTAPPLSAGRLVLCSASDSELASLRVPTLTLPGTTELLARSGALPAGVSATASSIAVYRRLVLADGLPLRDAAGREEIEAVMKSRQRVSAAATGGSGHCASSLRLQASGSPGTMDEDARAQLKRRYQTARRVLAEHVIGLDDLQKELAAILALWATDASANLLTIALVGPSGAGKNHTLEAVAQLLTLPEYFDQAAPRMYSYNFGKDGDAKSWDLLGVGIGHVGADRPGLLESVASGGPGFVLTLDEVDKVGPNSPQERILLDLMDRECFRNGHATLVNMPKGILALTMNTGTEEKTGKMGFSSTVLEREEQGRREAVLEHMRAFYERAFLAPLKGRLQHVWFLTHATTQEIEEIAQRGLGDALPRWTALGIADPACFDMAAEARRIAAQTQMELGARGIRHAVSQLGKTLFQAAIAADDDADGGQTSRERAQAHGKDSNKEMS